MKETLVRVLLDSDEWYPVYEVVEVAPHYEVPANDRYRLREIPRDLLTRYQRAEGAFREVLTEMGQLEHEQRQRASP